MNAGTLLFRSFVYGIFLLLYMAAWRVCSVVRLALADFIECPIFGVHTPSKVYLH